ncbi:MAG: YfiR family protein [Candidatus Acidiferrum sp.]
MLRLCFLVAPSILSLLVCLFPLSELHSADTPSKSAQYQLEAAFIFHFAQLVDWPPEALGGGNFPLVFCMTAENASSVALGFMVEGKHIGTHPVQVRQLKGKDDFRGCHLLFIVGKNKKRAASILESLKDLSILTVGESEDFALDGGMIGFFLEENKICFDINLKAAKRVNLKIDSRLLLLGKKVIGSGKQG